MCKPSRRLHASATAATAACRQCGQFGSNGQIAATAATVPTERDQETSTQPELPLRCWIIQASAIVRLSAAPVSRIASASCRSVKERNS